MISARIGLVVSSARHRGLSRALRPAILALGLAWSSLVAWPHAASAQEGADESRATTFQAVEGPQKENVPGGPLLVAAYGFVLASLVAYVVRLALMQRKTSTEVDRLSALLEQKRKA
jgi:hypothetical protein